ncbi:hypothetical protein Aph02nite_75500 [Actinoplanes philippinensis]|uniref:hypothetical protein n=1 Tax=Actinoplanes philippinensis TaxID=35752 RepID=UPI0011606FCB|nr:hypothetical protein [Actinoplanes philippinensis]GIE81600.1 hypothetical protein Aph02nite_75500 [Actinoplanes philippinensis]
MKDSSDWSPTVGHVDALRAYGARARDRAHQRAVIAEHLSERARAARRDADLARDRAAALHADQRSRRAAAGFA